MKKLLSFFMMLLLCFAVACGGKEDVKEDSGEIDITKLSDFTVNFSINPKFQLKLSHDGIIQGLECLNDDAKKVCEKINPVGENLEDGLRPIIDQMVVHGYLESGDFVEIQLHFAEGNQAICEKWATEANTVFRTLAAEYNVTELEFGGGFGYDEELKGNYPGIGSENAGETQGEVSDNPNQGQENGDNYPDNMEADGVVILQVDRDADGHVIYYLETDPDGNQFEYFFDGKGTEIRRLVTMTNGEIEETLCRADGTREKTTQTHPDGYVRVTLYNEEGIPVSANGQWPDGRTSQREYDKDGNPVREEAMGPNGEKEVVTFHSNGEMATLTVTLPDGSVHEETRDENGVVLSNVEKHADGTIVENTCDSDGRVLVAKETRPDGVVETRTYTYYPNGKPKTSEMKGSDGSYSMCTYYENGDMKTEDRTDSNGNHSTMVFSQDGLTREETDSMGVKTITTFHASNRAIASKKDYHPSGAVNEHYYNEAGVEYRTYWREANGRYGEAVYNADDSGSQTTWAADGTRIGVLYFDPTGRVTHGIDSNGNTYVPPSTMYAGKNQPGNMGKG